MGGKTPAVGETYTVVIDPDTALEEIVDVHTYVSGNLLTITRAIDGSSAVGHSAGAVIRHMVIGRDLQEANTHIENTNTAHGLTIANVANTTGFTMSGAIAMGSSKITGLGTPVSGTDAVTKNYADTMLPLAGGTMSGAIAMGSSKITGLGTPTASGDAVTKAYADAILVSAPGNLTGPITSVGAATSIASQTGTGTKFVVDTSPTLAGTVTASGDIRLSASGAFGSVKDFQTLILMDAL